MSTMHEFLTSIWVSLLPDAFVQWGRGGQLGATTYVSPTCRPQPSANNERCLPGVTPDSPTLFNYNKSLWLCEGCLVAAKPTAGSVGPAFWFPQIGMLLIGTRSAHQVLCGGLLSHGEDEAAALNRKHKCLSWIFIWPSRDSTSLFGSGVFRRDVCL